MNWRSDKLLKACRDAPICFGCGRHNDGTIMAAHSNQLRDGKGKGIKAHDFRVASLCYTCHSALDQGSKLSYEERISLWEDAHRKTIGWLFLEGVIKV